MATKAMSREQLIALFEQRTDKAKKPAHEERKGAEERQSIFRGLMNEGASTEEKERKADIIGGIAIALAAQQKSLMSGDFMSASDYAKKKWGENSPVAKAMQGSSDIAGGFTIAEELSQNLIDLLWPAAIMRSMGCQVMPLVNGQLRIPKITSAATATYLTEGGTIQATQPGFGQLLLQGKKLGAKVPISNDLLKFSALNVDSIVRQHIVRKIALREDLAFIEGNGDQGTPVGIRNHMLPTNQIAMTATPTAVTATSDAARMTSVLDNANVPDIKRGWIMRPNVKNWLAQVREATGALAFPSVMTNGTWWGYPIKTTTQLSIDVAGPPTQSMVYLAEFTNCIIGDAYTLEIDASNVAAYTDATQTLVSPFDRDETVIRAIEMHDFGLEHDECVAALTGVTWGG